MSKAPTWRVKGSNPYCIGNLIEGTGRPPRKEGGGVLILIVLET